jgi:hypothetical protein
MNAAHLPDAALAADRNGCRVPARANRAHAPNRHMRRAMMAAPNRRWLLAALAGHNGYTLFIELLDFLTHKARMRVVQPSQRWIARKIGRSPRQVVRLSARAERHGVTRVERRRWKDGRWRTNAYTVTKWGAVSRMGNVVRASATPLAAATAAKEQHAKAAKRRQQVADLVDPIGRPMPGCEHQRPEPSRRAPAPSRPPAAALPPSSVPVAALPAPGEARAMSSPAERPAAPPADPDLRPKLEGVDERKRRETQRILDMWTARGKAATDAPGGRAETPVEPPAHADADTADPGATARIEEAQDSELAELFAEVEAEEAHDVELAELFAEVQAEEAQRFADLPPLPPQPGIGASDEQVEAYRQAQIRRLKVLGLYEPPGAVLTPRATGPPRSGPYQPRRPPLPREEAEAELKRRGLY